MMITHKDKADFKVLLVEDEFLTVRGTARGIGFRVNEVDKAATIKDASSLVESKTYDLIIVDVRLPETPGGGLIAESGLDFITDLHAGKHGVKNKQTQFMVLTAQGRSVKIDSLEGNDKCVGVYGKLSHIDVIEKIEELIENKREGEA